jgi:hypothetical protein
MALSVVRAPIPSNPVSGQLRVGKPQIHNHWSAFRGLFFLDDKQSIHAERCSRQLRLNCGLLVIRPQSVAEKNIPCKFAKRAPGAIAGYTATRKLP